jgi:hypothetical protein
LNLASAGVHILNIVAESCFLEFTVKVLQVTEPLEDRMEKALFSPPLSKQRVEFAVRHINELHATTLVNSPLILLFFIYEKYCFSLQRCIFRLILAVDLVAFLIHC